MDDFGDAMDDGVEMPETGTEQQPVAATADRASMSVVRAAWVLILLAIGALWLLGGVLFRRVNHS